MKLINCLYLLASMTMINAQDDNPSGHELHDHLDDSVFTSLSTSVFDDSVFTSVFDDSALKVSSGDENILKYGFLLWAFLIL
jgi:hypothetical protein